MGRLANEFFVEVQPENKIAPRKIAAADSWDLCMGTLNRNAVRFAIASSGELARLDELHLLQVAQGSLHGLGHGELVGADFDFGIQRRLVRRGDTGEIFDLVRAGLYWR